MFQTILENDIAVMEEFSKNGTKDGKIFEKTKTPELVLRHVACVPIYLMLELQSFTTEELPPNLAESSNLIY